MISVTNDIVAGISKIVKLRLASLYSLTISRIGVTTNIIKNAKFTHISNICHCSS